MKKIIFNLLLAFGLILFGFAALGQVPDPPGGHGQTGDQPAGGGAPIGSGLTLLIALGVAYGARKTYFAWKNLEE